MSPGKKNYKVRTGARTASKGLEKELKRKAKRLSQDPSLALPRCTTEVSHFKKLEKKLEEIQKVKDSKKALEKYSKKGDRLARAYAATLVLMHEEKIPYIAVLKTPFGEAGYALRGSTSREKLAGIQNYDNPRIKMMAFLDDVRKKKLFMFVTDDEVICTGSDPKPPKEILDALPRRLGKGIKKSGDIIHSPDLAPRDVRERRSLEHPYLIVEWTSAGIKMAKSYPYTLQNKDNTFATCASYMASAKMSRHFDLDVVVEPICEKKGDCACRPPPKEEKKGSFLERLGKVKEPTSKELYLEGKFMDHRLIEKEIDDYRDRLNEIGETVYIIGNRCYSDDADAMLDSIGCTSKERRVLEVFLERAEGPILSSDPTANKIMEPFWKDVGKGVLQEISGSKKVASEVFDEFPTPRYQPMNIVQEAEFRVQEKKVRKELPEPKDPPKMIRFAYECAIAYLVRGAEGASKVVEEYSGGDIKLKAAKYAFVKALNLTKSAGWSYTTHEMGYAQGLDSIVKEMVTRNPEAFKKGLSELWKATGSTKDLKWK